MPTATVPTHASIAAELRARLDAVDQILKPPEVSDVRSGGGGGNDDADYAASHIQHEDAVAVRSRFLVEQRELRQALQRIAEGTFGVCANEECGEPIGEARLRAVPAALFCVSCQGKTEHRETRRRRARGWDEVEEPVRIPSDGLRGFPAAHAPGSEW